MSSLIDFVGKTLIVATNESPPYVFLQYNTENKSWQFTGGFEVMLINSLSKYFNFTYRIVNCSSDWGVLLKNNSWTGIVGELYYKRADLGFSGLTVTEQRAQVVYFAAPHIITSVSFLTPPPKLEQPFSLGIEPFEPSVWLCIITAILLLTVTQWIVFRYHSRTTLKRAYRISEIIFLLLRQPICRKIQNIQSIRIMLSSWLLASLVLSTVYGGFIFSLMTIVTEKGAINSLQQLATKQKAGLIQVVAIKGSSYYESLKKTRYGIHAEIGKQIEAVNSKTEGLDIVRNSSKPYAYISTRDHLLYGMHLYGTNSYYLPPATEEATVFTDMMSIAMRKDFQYKMEFNTFISNIKKGGFIDYWRYQEHCKLIKKYVSSVNFQQRIDSSQPQHNFSVLALENMQSSFHIYMAGNIISLLFLVIEAISRASFCTTLSKNAKT